MSVLIILGSSGGVIAVITAILVVGRGIFRQVTATEENTEAVKELSAKMEAIVARVNQHEVDIAVLKEKVGKP